MIYTKINSYNLRTISYDNLTLLHPAYDMCLKSYSVQMDNRIA